LVGKKYDTSIDLLMKAIYNVLEMCHSFQLVLEIFTCN